jgi:hypothetical protein
VDDANPPELDADWYCEQLLRAADEIMQPFGVPKDILAVWLAGRATYWGPEDFIEKAPLRLPILEEIAQTRRKRKNLSPSSTVRRL